MGSPPFKRLRFVPEAEGRRQQKREVSRLAQFGPSDLVAASRLAELRKRKYAIQV
jgi:hypothetical protein